MREPRTWRVRPSGVTILTIIFLVGSFIIYWLLARLVQDINYHIAPSPYVEGLLISFPLLEPLLVFFELASFSVLRHLLPLAFGVICAWFITVELVQILYDLPTKRTAQSMLSRLFTGVGKAITLDRRTFSDQRISEDLIRTGGPGQIIVGESDAAVTEINGRFERVLGAGKQKLRRFEKIVFLLDLREQEHAVQNVSLMTREGLPINTNIRLLYRLQQRSDALNPDAAYKFDDDSIRKAAYANIVTDEGITRWDNLPAAIATSQLRKIISSTRMDELIDPQYIFENDPHPTIQVEMEQNTRDILRNFGIHLISARISALQMSKEMHDMLLAYWKSFGEQAKEIEGRPQQPDFDKEDLQRSLAREKMITSLTTGLQTIRERKNAASRGERKSAAPELDPNKLLTLQMIRLLQQIKPQQQNQTQLESPRDQLTAGEPARPEQDQDDLNDQLDKMLNRYLPPEE